MKKQRLFNKVNRELLKKALINEPFKRFTASFYKYFEVDSPSSFRDNIYNKFNQLKIFGRIYIAKEGINAQVSVPEHKWSAFFEAIKKMKELEQHIYKKSFKQW